MRTTRLLTIACLLALPWHNLAVAAPAAQPASAEVPGDNCATCDKRIYFGERCITCRIAAKRKQIAHPCETCEKTIWVGDRCAKCALISAKQSLTQTCSDCDQTAFMTQRCTSCTATHMQGRLDQLLTFAGTGGSKLGGQAAARLNGLKSFLPSQLPEALDPAEIKARAAEALAVQKAEDGWLARANAWTQEHAPLDLDSDLPAELRLRADRALGVALEIAASVETTKRDLAEAGLNRALRLPVKSAAGWTTLEDLATTKLLLSVPELEGTDLINDPAAVLAALVVADPMAFLMDLQLVPNGPGKALSIVDAMAEKGATDPETALACLTLIEATRKLRRGEDITRAMRDITRSLEILAPQDQ